MSIKTLAFSVLAVAACATAARAQDYPIVLDNVHSAGITASSDGTLVAAAFVTGPTVTILGDVMFPQLQQPTGFAASTYIYNYSLGETLSLYTTNLATGLPNAVPQLTLSGSALSFGPGSMTTAFTLPAAANTYGQTTATVPGDAASQLGAVLLPNQKYWLELNNSSTVSWDFSSTLSYSSTSGFTFPSTGFSTEVNKSNGSSAQYVFTDGPQEISISVVPEPSAYCAMAIAGLALVVSRKRSRNLA